MSCGICMDEIVQQGFINCGHLFCVECIKKWAQINNTCPMCKKRFRVITEQPVASSTDPSGPSRKRALRGAPKTHVRDVKPRPEDFFDAEEYARSAAALGLDIFQEYSYHSSEDEDYNPRSPLNPISQLMYLQDEEYPEDYEQEVGDYDEEELPAWEIEDEELRTRLEEEEEEALSDGEMEYIDSDEDLDEVRLWRSLRIDLTV